MEYLLIGDFERSAARGRDKGFRNLSAQDGLLQSLPEGIKMNLANAVLQLKKEKRASAQENGTTGLGSERTGGSGQIQPEGSACSDAGQETESYVRKRRGNELRRPSAHVGRSGKQPGEANKERGRRLVPQPAVPVTPPTALRGDGGLKPSLLVKSSQVEGARRNLLL